MIELLKSSVKAAKLFKENCGDYRFEFQLNGLFDPHVIAGYDERGYLFTGYSVQGQLLFAMIAYPTTHYGHVHVSHLLLADDQAGEFVYIFAVACIPEFRGLLVKALRQMITNEFPNQTCVYGCRRDHFTRPVPIRREHR